MTQAMEQERYPACPVCGSPAAIWRNKANGEEVYPIEECTSCGFAFVNPRPSFRFLMDFYATSGHGDSDSHSTPTLKSVLATESDYPNSSLDAKRIVKTISGLIKKSQGRRFLDVGCGYGFFSNEAKATGFDISMLELADNERAVAKEMTGLEPAHTSFEDYTGSAGSTDVVLMSQILEHALDINLWITKAYELLDRDGVLAVALPNFGSLFRRLMQENEPYICPPAHLNFFNPKSLSKLLEKHGFVVEKVQWVSRLPKSAFVSRLPSALKPLLPAVNMISTASMKTIDAFHLGMIINVYARKVS